MQPFVNGHASQIHNYADLLIKSKIMNVYEQKNPLGYDRASRIKMRAMHPRPERNPAASREIALHLPRNHPRMSDGNSFDFVRVRLISLWLMWSINNFLLKDGKIIV